MIILLKQREYIFYQKRDCAVKKTENLSIQVYRLFLIYLLVSCSSLEAVITFAIIRYALL